ncbi:MAG: S8 family serine peptidase, partial [Nitrospira sp.]|nr:S8 family serine peptidase [Nitrospira sp.]
MKRLTTYFMLPVLFLSWGLASAQENPEFLKRAAQEILDKSIGVTYIPTEETFSTAPPEEENLSETNLEPPPGASHLLPAQEAISVFSGSTRTPRFSQKPVPGEVVPRYASNSPSSPTSLDEWRKLSFSSGALVSPSGVDERMSLEASLLKGEGRNFVYGFLLMNEFLSEETQRELEGLGVRLLGPHVNHYKVKLPVDGIDQVAQLPYVEWIGYSAPEQKWSLELHSLRAKASVEAALPAELPIIINLFDADLDGEFRRELESRGVKVGPYDPELLSYEAVASWAAMDQITVLDFVLFIELVQEIKPDHPQSMALIDADTIRVGGSWGTRYSGFTIPVGIIDSGFMMGSSAPVMHQDLNKWGCGINFTSTAGGIGNDESGHGTHVLGTLAGTGTADRRYRGVAPGVGSSQVNRIRAAKVITYLGEELGYGGYESWLLSAMDWMDDASACSSPRPMVINYSGGADVLGSVGTDSRSRKLDEKVWTYRQVYVVSAGNLGPDPETIHPPGVAKNALTVGNIQDWGYQIVGDIFESSSRGPTRDGRMKPNVVAPGTSIASAQAGTTDWYIALSGTSQAAPHVTGLVATLMHHYPDLRWNPALLRAHIMATAIPHDNVTGKSNDFGLGRVSSYLAHWEQNNASGWSTQWFSGVVSRSNWAYGDIEVPEGAQRLVVVLTWDEPAASSGAGQAVSYDIDLWVDRDANCNHPKGTCGEYYSYTHGDNVEYIVIDNP